MYIKKTALLLLENSNNIISIIFYMQERGPLCKIPTETDRIHESKVTSPTCCPRKSRRVSI